MMTAYERVKHTIEFAGPDRIPIAGNCMEYESHGDVIYHFPKMRGVSWWTGGGGVDEWGCRWESNRENDMGQVVEHPLHDLAEVGQLTRPSGLDPFRYSDLERELLERPDAYHVFCNGPVLFERMHFLRGFDTLLLDMVEDPDGFRRFADWTVEYQVETVRYLAEHFRGKIHALRCTDDLGSQSNSIMSPRAFRELLKPYYTRVAELCHRHGMHFWLHSCGRIDGLLDDLIEAGVDVVNMMQLRLFDLGELGRRFGGRITFEGYPDMQMTVPTGDRERIRADIAEQLRCLAAPRGGYLAMWEAPRYLKSQCLVDDSTLSQFIADTYRELDPYLE